MAKKSRAPAQRRTEVEVIRADPEKGLSLGQVEHRRVCGWVNTTSEGVLPQEREIVLRHCLTFFNFVFVVLGLFLVIAGSSIKNMAFLVVVVINTVIGIVQELRAKRAVEKLTLVAAQKVTVIRDGKPVQIRSATLVRDDIAQFSAGDQICADGILRSGALTVNEALITGEEDGVVKGPGDELKSGSFVISGKGRVQITKVGDDAYAATLAREAKAGHKTAKSEMMASLDKMIRVMGIVLVPVGILLFARSMADATFRDSVEGTVAALVGMIPEGLYLLTSIALAASSVKLARKKVLVRDLNCIETLARVDVLCVDKTGTITEPAMEVEELVPLSSDDPEYLEAILRALFTTKEPENDTAAALARMYGGEHDWVCTQRVAFDSQRKWSGAGFRGHGAFLVGAPEFILGSRYWEISHKVTPWTQQGYRVLLAACYATDLPKDTPDPDQVTPLALILLNNRIRSSAPETFRYFREQGVAVKVISGDDPATAADAAKRAGIPGAEAYVDASGLENREALLDAVESYTVFGRVTPDMKKKLVQALKEKKHTVAMTGDGVNDVLAMREAHCGIAMAGGAQAAEQVAQMVLLGSDFSAMPDIVGEGRRVINNIQRAAALFLVKNIYSLLLALGCMAAGLAYHLQAINLTLVSSLTIGIPSFFLALEPNYERVTGRFLSGAVKKALAGGLAGFAAVFLAHILGMAFSLPDWEVATASTAILCVVGIVMLLQVCRPFTVLRKIVVGGVTAAVVLAFLLLGELFEVDIFTGAAAGLSVSLAGGAVALYIGLQLLIPKCAPLFQKKAK